jgi:aspartate/methionine/tyrosine aminotransferase
MTVEIIDLSSGDTGFKPHPEALASAIQAFELSQSNQLTDLNGISLCLDDTKQNPLILREVGKRLFDEKIPFKTDCSDIFAVTRSCTTATKAAFAIAIIRQKIKILINKAINNGLEVVVEDNAYSKNNQSDFDKIERNLLKNERLFQKFEDKLKDEGVFVKNSEIHVLVPQGYYIRHGFYHEMFGGEIKVIPTNPKNDFSLKGSTFENTLLFNALKVKNRYLTNEEFDAFKERIDESQKKALIAEYRQKNIALLLFTNPNNPITQPCSKEDLQDIANMIVKYKIPTISDELLSKLVDKHIPIASLLAINFNGKKESLHNHVMTITGSSKTINVKSFRVGVGTTGDKLWYEATVSYLEKHHPCVQKDAIYCGVALIDKTPESYYEEIRKELKRRRDFFIEKINKINSKFKKELDGQNAIIFTAPLKQGFWSVITVHEQLLKKVGIKDSAELQKYFLTSGRIVLGDASKSGITGINLRINISCCYDVYQRDFDYHRINEVLNRIENNIIVDMNQGSIFEPESKLNTSLVT